jgi:hypothetical protein
MRRSRKAVTAGWSPNNFGQSSSRRFEAIMIDGHSLAPHDEFKEIFGSVRRELTHSEDRR